MKYLVGTLEQCMLWQSLIHQEIQSNMSSYSVPYYAVPIRNRMTLDWAIPVPENTAYMQYYNNLSLEDFEQEIPQSDRDWFQFVTEFPDIPALRIQHFHEMNINQVKNFDYRILGLKKESFFEKGRKTHTTYKDEEDNIVIKATCSDVVENEKLVAINYHIEWYMFDDTVGLEKTYSKYLSQEESGDELKNRRQRVVNNMVSFTVGTPLNVPMQQLFEFYEVDVVKYINTGDESFKNGVTNPTDPTITAILSIAISADRTLQQAMLVELS